MGGFRAFIARMLPEDVRQAVWDVWRHPQSRPVLDLGIGSQNTVFLAGGARSGTGWVANIINYDNSYRYMYEPFHRQFTPIAKGFRYGLYIRPDDRDPCYLKPARSIVRGTVWHNYTMHVYNTKPIATRRLIKEVRANLWLKWLRVNFPRMPIVLLVRHPCATVHSRMHRGNPLFYEEFLNQAELIEDYLGPYWHDILGAGRSGEFEQRLFVWCIQHFVPLRQLAKDEAHVVFYEQLASEPYAEVGKLFGYLGKKFDERVFEALKRPSHVARADAPIRTGKSVLDSWRANVTPDQMRAAARILSVFGLDRIYGDDPKPNPDGLAAFRAIGRQA